MKKRYREKRLTRAAINKAVAANNPVTETLKDWLLKRVPDWSEKDWSRKRKLIKKHIKIDDDEKYVYVYCNGILIEQTLRHGYHRDSNYMYILQKYGL